MPSISRKGIIINIVCYGLKIFPRNLQFFKIPLHILSPRGDYEVIVYVGCYMRKEMSYGHLFLTLWMKIWELKYQKHIWSQGHILLHLIALFLSQIRCSTKTIKKNCLWYFAYYLQLENKITVIIPVMSHSTQANILNKLNSSIKMFTCTQ